MKKSKKMPILSLIMGSENDFPIMRKAAEILTEFNIPFEMQVVSAHRTPDWMVEFAKGASIRGIQVIIAGAGGAAHLPGMVASLTHLPVIGVPIQVGSLQGVDALMSILQMPKGIPVATVAIDNATNAALLAARILGLTDEKISKAVQTYQTKQRDHVLSRKNSLRL